MSHCLVSTAAWNGKPQSITAYYLQVRYDNNNNIIILSFDIAPFPYKHAQRRITFHCQRIDVDIHIVN